MKTPTIIPRITGGMGNQLFIYAAARRLALVNNAELAIDDISGFARDYAYQRQYQLNHFSIPCRKATAAERLEPFSRMRRYLKRYFDRRKPFEKRDYLRQQHIDFDSRILEVQPSGILYLEGYWQSEKYFKDIESTIRKELKIKPPSDDKNLSMAEKIRSHTAVSVHVRFFDVPESDRKINSVSSNYYRRAITKIESLIPNAHYYVFSDSPEDACNLLSIPTDCLTTVSHNKGDDAAYADLWLMTQCNHFVIANSTFSWWGAWLAEESEKVVISPGKVSGSVTAWGFDGLIPDSWIVVEDI